MKLHTDESPKEGGILSLQEIYDYEEMFGEENQKVAYEKTGNMCLVHVRAAEGRSRGGRAAPVGRNHTMAGMSERAMSVLLTQLCSLCACGAGEPCRAVTWPKDFSSGDVLKLERLGWISKGDELNASRLGKSSVKITCQPKRPIRVLSKHKAT